MPGWQKEGYKEVPDATLLFMTMCVSMTAENEMPIVAPFTGEVPKDIMGITRIGGVIDPRVAPHFYLKDEKIRAFWNKPFQTAHRLSRFHASVSMDFSMTAEMSKIQKMYSSFLNKLWAAWLQSRGLKVIPNVSFPDEYWEDYWLEGWPKHSIIAVNSVGVLRHGDPELWLKGMLRIREKLKPILILRYGPVILGEDIENCIYFDNDNNRATNGR